MNITIFGGSQARPGDQTYQEAYLLGSLLSKAGHTILTGGYIGVMEAASKGASESGGHVIGITCDEIEKWRPVGPNPWVKEERRYPTLRQRLFALIDNCDAAIAMPGGIGTLAEIAEIWSQVQSQAITPRPIILVGNGWKQTFTTLYAAQGDFIPERYRELLKFAENSRVALAVLNIPAAGNELR
jgi:uncharacterized protein (TIGR00730 family)